MPFPQGKRHPTYEVSCVIPYVLTGCPETERGSQVAKKAPMKDG